MRRTTSLLLAAAPRWFEAVEGGVDDLRGIARVPGTPWSDDGLEIAIAGGAVPHAGKRRPGTVLPARCPERHIQSDRTFCMGLRHTTVENADDAERWWEQLRVYLVCQGVAERTGVWPPTHALDHGDAGGHHERALDVAREAQVEEEYAAARLDEPSWITDPDLRLIDRTGRPINGRAVCPRGCRRRASRNAPILRRACGRRRLLAELVQVERLRRSALAEYWRAVREAGTVCCGTMLACPLRVAAG